MPLLGTLLKILITYPAEISNFLIKMYIVIVLSINVFFYFGKVENKLIILH